MPPQPQPPKPLPPSRQPLPLRLQFVDLLWIELSNWRWSWQPLLLTAILSPVLSIIALGSFTPVDDQAARQTILIGTLVMSLMFSNLGNVSSRFAYMRFAGVLDFYATLPIQRSLLVFAIVSAFFLLSCPALVITLLFGASFLKVTLSLSSLIVLVLPLCVLPLAGVGAAIGINAPNPEVAGGLTLLVTMLALFIGPVLLPANRLPEIVQGLGYLSPATYAASALRQTLLGPITPRLWIDCGVLMGFIGMTGSLVRIKYSKYLK